MNTYRLNTFQKLSALISAFSKCRIYFLFVWLVYFNSKVFWSDILRWKKYEIEHFQTRDVKHIIIWRPGGRIHAERGSDLSTQDFFCDNIFGLVPNVQLFLRFLLQYEHQFEPHWTLIPSRCNFEISVRWISAGD